MYASRKHIMTAVGVTVAHEARIRKILGSNFGQDTGCHD
jgi:hypothetical protein